MSDSRYAAFVAGRVLGLSETVVGALEAANNLFYEVSGLPRHFNGLLWDGSDPVCVVAGVHPGALPFIKRAIEFEATPWPDERLPALLRLEFDRVTRSCLDAVRCCEIAGIEATAEMIALCPECYAVPEHQR